MKTLTADQLRMVLSGPRHARIIDVLSPDHYEREHIDGAVNIPHDADDFIEQVDRITDDRSHSVIVYCASTTCPDSGVAARKLMKAGYTNVYDFEGGLDAWKKIDASTVSMAAAG